MFSTPVMLEFELIWLVNSSIKSWVLIDEALSVDITIINESLDTEFWNCADIMSSALLDSRLLSDEEPN